MGNGDPHLGNILLLDDGRIGLMDYGQVKHLNKIQRKNLSKLILALADGTKKDVVKSVHEDLGLVTKYMDPYVLEIMERTMMDRDDREITEGMNTVYHYYYVVLVMY